MLTICQALYTDTAIGLFLNYKLFTTHRGYYGIYLLLQTLLSAYSAYTTVGGYYDNTTRWRILLLLENE